ncbi:MAG: response regulator [bacterium]|nr:response regulator [bacterium]
MVEKFRKILVVEDNRPLANAMHMKLRDRGYEVEEAHDGKEALEKLEQDHIDLFLLDLIMPEMDGFSFLEEFNRRNVKAGVIVVSNVSDEDNVKKLKDLGVSDYLIKSNYKLEEIVDKVDAYFQKK